MAKKKTKWNAQPNIDFCIGLFNSATAATEFGFHDVSRYALCTVASGSTLPAPKGRMKEPRFYSDISFAARTRVATCAHARIKSVAGPGA